MGIDLLIGCPIYRREFYLPRWFEHIEIACNRAAVVPGFVFVMDPSDESVDVIIEETGRRDWIVYKWVWVEEDGTPLQRIWNMSRYVRMCELRNLLLAAVREIDPPLFLSLDSDILLHQDSIVGMIEGIVRFDVVGGKTYMTSTGTNFPSYGIMANENDPLARWDTDTGVMPVDVVMAIKLMKPSAYDVEYTPHSKGEDVGFSFAARKLGLKLGWDGRYASKHCMTPDALERIDSRCGF